METIEAVWNRVEIWLTHHAPTVLKVLHPGGTDEELRLTEAILGIELPQDVRASYFVHNGSNGHSFTKDGRLLSLAEMGEHWQMMKSLLDKQDPNDPSFFGFGSQDEESLSEPLQLVWWHPKWIPLIQYGNGDGLYVDLAPGLTGDHGQLVSFFHEDYSMNDIVAPSWLAYFSAFADDLEAGKYLVDEQGFLERDWEEYGWE